MSEMIERVAKAMAKSEGDPVMDHWRVRARAAIEAMREPTQPMLQAAGDDWYEADISWRMMIDAELARGQQ